MTTETAVTVIEQSPDAVVDWNLDNWPTSEFNRLVPTQTLGLVTDLIRPIVQVVQLDIERDTYQSNDLPAGHRAPNAKGLALLAAAAGVDFPDEIRMDDGSDPGRASAKVWATMVDGTGRTRTIVGSRDYVLKSQKMTDPQRERAKGHVYENALTRARHRALRLLLGLAQSYPVAELQKPFAVVSYVPNLQHPELREAYKQALLPTVAAMYGPGAAKQLAAGNEVIDLDKGTPRDVTPSSSTPDEPDWMKGSVAATEAPKPKPAEKPDFLVATRAFATEGDDAEELATADELGKLREVFAFAAQNGSLVGAGIAALWPDQQPNNLSKGQARAIARAADSLGPEAFEAAWRRVSSAEAVPA